MCAALPRLMPGFALAALALCLAAQGALGGEAAPAPAPPAAEQTAPETRASDLTTRSQAALADLDRIRAAVGSFGEPDAQAARLEALQSRVAELLPDDRSVEQLLEDPAQIDGVLIRSRNLTTQAGGLIDELTTDAEALEVHLGEVTELIARWQATRDDADRLPEALAGRVSDILESADALQRDVNARLNRLIEIQDGVMAARNAIMPIAERIDSYDRTLQTRLFEQNTSRLWEVTSDHISRSSERATRVFTGTFRADLKTWLESSETSIGGHFLLLPVILLLLFRLRQVTEAPGSALGRPVPTGVLIWMLIGVAIYAGSPPGVRVIYVATVMLVAAGILVRAVPKRIRRGVVLFVALALAHEFVQSLPVQEQLPRVAYLLMAVVLAALGWAARRRDATRAVVEWGAPRALVLGALNVSVFLLTVSVIANVLGYVVLARQLVVGVVDSAAVFLVLFAGFSSVSEIIQVTLRLPALDEVRSIAANRYRLERVLRKPLVWISLGLWAWATLNAFGISDWLFGSVDDLVSAEASFGTVTISIGGVLLFVLAVWLAVWFSRALRAVLNLDVFPRMRLPRGLPNTVSMTMHYSIILLGLLIGFGSLGMDLTNVAFIIGALGVGIGFGLQNVVNNFVSGLILIFEAPIQVGDTVEVGTLTGQVTQIGIRTSRVRTFSGSEVIVPNGDLVSNQVVNWTLSDRHRRLELNLGVAYGSDPDAVAELIRGVVEADPDVQQDPKPLVIFSGFGASSLDFRILVWISDFDQGLPMTHRLNAAINGALAKAGIAIPFPQQDVYVKALPDRGNGPA